MIPLWDAISSSAVLEEVRLSNQRNTGMPVAPAVVNQILEATDRNNSSIKKLELTSSTVRADSLSTFLRKTMFLTTLTLRRLEFEETPDSAQAAQNLSASIAQNNSIEVMECSGELVYQAAIFTSLAKHRLIREIDLSSMKVHVESLSTFLKETKSLTNLGLHSLEFTKTLDPIEAGRNLSASIAQNKSIKVMKCSGELVYQAAIFTGFAEHI